MAPPPVPPAKKVQQSPEVSTTAAKGQEGNAEGSPLISKPLSRAGSVAPSSKGHEAQDDGRDDVSVAESSKVHRKTEEDRLQFFHDQPECREVEPHRAFCIGCDQWVPLNPTRTYVMRPWLIHRRECRRNSLVTKQATTKSSHNEGATLDGSEADDDLVSGVQSTSEKSGRFKGEAERQAYLEEDPRADEVRPYEVLCKTCKKWVQLGNKMRFSLSHWKVHQKRCSGSIPSNRIATAERKLRLVNDASAKSFSTKSVWCKHCDATIALEEGEGDYNLTRWEEHKTSCLTTPEREQAATHADGFPATTSDISPSRSERSEGHPSISVVSTEGTAVDAAGLFEGSKKRPRESDEDDPEADLALVLERSLHNLLEHSTGSYFHSGASLVDLRRVWGNQLLLPHHLLNIHLPDILFLFFLI
ncbi:hypothetical protein B0F90DRAFT_1947187 [Multifurca ochricompacta]|uniref:Uncharacterized protein n=1 Tax=Multifurca ochricompacta TaxID=376703 RepID=A0AAD4M9A4_9AGAM|nr:hypothetical protein B0F90DRAFT_1947187 [Multifurca ochricompacta]